MDIEQLGQSSLLPRNLLISVENVRLTPMGMPPLEPDSKTDTGGTAPDDTESDPLASDTAPGEDTDSMMVTDQSTMSETEVGSDTEVGSAKNIEILFLSSHSFTLNTKRCHYV